MNRTLIIRSIIGVIVLMIGLVGSYFIFNNTSVGSNLGYQPALLKNGSIQFDPSLPKTESCPLNGAMYSKQQRDWWEKHAPMGVMIENEIDARPQSGWSFADVVYEAVAEGGITRTLSVFYCQDPGIVGPVRSARTYFLDWISEYGAYPLYVHVGGANQAGPANALGQIEDYGWGGFNDISGLSVGAPVFVRDYNRNNRDVAYEHTDYSNTDQLWNFAASSRGITNTAKGVAWDQNFVPYKFKDDAAQADRGSVNNIHVEFWSSQPDYTVNWKYNQSTNSYLRSDGNGKPYIDRDTEKQIAAKNVIVLQMSESDVNDGYSDGVHQLFGDIGTGKATVFLDGKKIDGTWSKASRTDRTLITDQNGNPVVFNKGLMWFEIYSPTDGALTTP